ncbi:DUF4249 domain-containing protein [uncultured Pontibacter sp.]|uniref:DUF4249 domain-containing protein n=1 Tax=uncultured Pontibacter sp. TaxID=453356 RepID=UPI00262FF9B4|nr:DUF4249 domain-containing protein [uncultured Pontibacter sp.]
MRLKNYLLAVMIIAAIALQSCEKDVENFDISTKPMLVTTAFLSPQDTILTVEVKLTQPAIGKQLSEEQLKVKNATVVLSDGTQQTQLEYDEKHNKYFAPMASLPIVSGKAYFLRVTTPTGEKAEAECVVPSLEGIHFTGLHYETNTQEQYDYSWLMHVINFKWQDAPGVENYYHLSGYRSYVHDIGYPAVRTVQHEPFHADPFKIYARDTEQDGQIMQSPNFGLTTSEEDHASKPFAIYAVLAVTDKAYYDYHQSVISQERSGNNPFAEPKRIYSNIRGGLGVFAAYNQIKVVRMVQ